MTSLFVSPLLDKLIGDAKIAALFSADAEIAAMLAFEHALAEAEAVEGVIPSDAAAAIASACGAFKPDIAALIAGTARDGVVVPEFVKQLRRAVGGPSGAYVHLGATSQDVIDTALVLRLRDALDIIGKRGAPIIARLDALAATDGGKQLMGRTRMQRARPITAAQKIANWRDPLARRLEEIGRVREALLVLQLGGAVGDRAELGGKAQAVADRMAAALQLRSASTSWHTQRDGMIGFAQWLALIAGHLGKIGADIALMAQNEVAEIKLAGGGGSSAMPHKVNPVGAEVLVALARQAATLAGGLHHASVHENERSGAAWTLEWALLPPLLVATGAALAHAQALLDGASFA